MEFVLTFQQPVGVYEDYADPIKGAEASQSWSKYMTAMAIAGVMRGGKQLDAGNSNSVRVRSGKCQVQQGPSAFTGELLGGYVIIDVPTLDDALKWAELSPSASNGCTEVWPVLPNRQA